MSYSKFKKTNKNFLKQQEEAKTSIIEVKQITQIPTDEIMSLPIYKTTAKLNLREDAGMDKEILTVIPKGDEVEYLGNQIDDDWYYVKYKEYTGFCLKNWLE